jgi:hypothetical protein
MKILFRIAIGLGLLLAIAVFALLVNFYVLHPKKREPLAVKAPSTPEAIERGRYLTHHVAGCVGCHSDVDVSKPGEPIIEGRTGAGRDFGEFEGFPARLRARNLTPDKETGIGAVSDGEMLRAMREGIGFDGRALFPMMPYQTYAKALSDEDALAIIAYLRTLPPIERDVGKTEIAFPVSMFIRAAPRPLEKPLAAPPAASDVRARGEWLLSLCSCRDCHDGFNERREPIAGRELSGGAPFPIPGKGTVYAANITSDKATGIGSYSDEDLLRALTEGISKSGRLLYGMPFVYYRGMTEEDKRALLVALRKVKPVSNVVPPPTFKP